jgi:hypothetical protein
VVAVDRSAEGDPPALKDPQVAAAVADLAGKTILQLHQEVAIQSSLGLAGLLLALVIMA